jgi:hypothetical protein
MQIRMLEGKGPKYGENFGLCNDLKEGKSLSEINSLEEAYANCDGYQRLEEKYVPFVKDMIKDTDILEKIDDEKLKDILNSLGN